MKKVEALREESPEVAKSIAASMRTVNGLVWEDVAGLKEVIEEIKRAIVHPHKYPHLYDPNETTPMIMLFGPS